MHRHSHSGFHVERLEDRLHLAAHPWAALADTAVTGIVTDLHVAAEFSPEQGRPAEAWQALAPMPRGRSEHSAVVVNGLVYLLGGINDPTTGVGPVDVWDPRTGAWTENITRVPQRRHHFNAVVHGNDIWVVGGKTSTDNTGTNRVDIYDTVSNTWRRGPDLPAEHWGGPAVIRGDHLHVLSGARLRTITNDHHFVLDLTDPNATWTTAASVRRPRVHAAAVSIDGRIYMIGGEFDHSHAGDRRDVQIYDPGTNSWSFGEPLPLPRSHIEWNTFVHNGEIWSVSGVDSGRDPRGQSEIFVYNPKSDSWRTFETPLPERLVSPASLVYQDTVYVFGGGINDWFDGDLRGVWSIALESTPTVPATPANLQATAEGPGRVRLAWTDASSNETGFRIERRLESTGPFVAIATVTEDTAEYLDTSVAPDTAYRYRVVAFNGAGDSNPSQPVTVRTPSDPTDQPPTPPEMLTLFQSQKDVELHWEDTSSVEEGFAIFRKGPSDASFVVIAETLANVTSYVDRNVTPGFYEYRVRSFNRIGTSPYISSSIEVNVDDVLPVRLTVSGTGFRDGPNYQPYDAFTVGEVTRQLRFSLDSQGYGRARIDALAQISSDQFLVSFSRPVRMEGLGLVDDADIVLVSARNDRYRFALFFDGSDVGLTRASEDVDALDLLPDGSLILSTTGNARGVDWQARDEDLLRFLPDQLGHNTTGSWQVFVDGSDLGLGRTDIDAVTVESPDRLHISFKRSEQLISGTVVAGNDLLTISLDQPGPSTQGRLESPLFLEGSEWGIRQLAAADVSLTAPADLFARGGQFRERQTPDP